MRRPRLLAGRGLRPGRRRARRAGLAGALVLVVGAATAFAVIRPGTEQHTLVAHFTRAVGVHAGSDVRVLGVRVGEVTSVTPAGGAVRIALRYDARHDLPADVRAVIVPPSLVSDRYVQLTPAYGGGARLADRAELPVARTAVPMEIDEIFRALDEFNQALGPDGANADGALADLVATGRANLAGNGEQLRTTLDGLSRALGTLADGRQDLFGTVANLQRFTTALAASDQHVRAFNAQLADVAGQLAGERDELAAALRNLAGALAEVTAFLRQNRAELTGNVTALADVTGVLVRQQKAIIDILDVAPLALSNLHLAYNPRSGTLDTRDNLTGPYDPASYVCAVLVDLLPATKVPAACAALAQTLAARKLPLPGQLKTLIGSATKRGASTPGGTVGAPSGVPTAPPAAPGPVASLDRTLGGILRGAR